MRNKKTNAIVVDGAVYERNDPWDLFSDQYDPELCKWEFVGYELPIFEGWQKGVIFVDDEYTHMCAKDEEPIPKVNKRVVKRLTYRGDWVERIM